MCGKFTAQRLWREVVEAAQARARAAEISEDGVVTCRPMDALPVIVFDRATGKRRVVPMRWGFPHRDNPSRPDPIHARAESIDEKPTFKDAFLGGQRGIVIMRTFNEGLELPNGKTEQWTIDPGDGAPRGFAFLWRRFVRPDLPGPMLACVMVTVPASKLIAPVTDRMPAILEDADWAKWLDEEEAAPDAVKTLLRTMEGVNWQMVREPKKPPSRARPQPGPGLF